MAHLTQETRVKRELDDVASSIRQAVPLGYAEGLPAPHRERTYVLGTQEAGWCVPQKVRTTFM